MRKWLVGLLALVCALSAKADGDFDMTALPLAQVINLYYREVSSRPFIVCSDVLADQRPVSIRASVKQLDGAAMRSLLAVHGLEARVEQGVTVICKKSEATADEVSTFFYEPKYRESSYLVELVSPLIKGTFANRRAAATSLAVGGEKAAPQGGGQQPAGASMKSGVGDDYVLFSGSDAEVSKLQKLLAQIDTPTGEVVVKGHIYEVGKNSSDGSAIDLVASALGGRLGVSVAGGVLANALRIKTGSLDVVASALSTDGRFKIVTSPFTRVRSGASARFVVGSEVPVLGAIVTNQGGQTQQSVEYRASGTIFEVSPRVRGKTTDLDLFQQVSAFVNTDTGVNSSPTLNKRELRTSLSVEDGEVLVIGGLNDAKDDSSRSGLSFLPFALSTSRGSRATELVIILELKRI